MAMIPMFFFLSLTLQQLLGYGPLPAGLATLPMSITLIVAAGMGSRWVSRAGPRRPLLTGMLLIAGGLGWFATVDVSGGYVVAILVPSLAVAAGGGLGFVAATTAATADVQATDAGAAAGLVTMAQELGGAVGLALLASVASLQPLSAYGSAIADDLATALRIGFLGAAAIALAGCAIATLVRQPRTATPAPHRPLPEQP